MTMKVYDDDADDDYDEGPLCRNPFKMHQL